MRRSIGLILLITALSITSGSAVGRTPGNLLQDPSFEMTKDKDRFGLVFARWGGWIYEGDCEFRVGQVAHTGRHSCLLFGGSAPKIRAAQNVELVPGRYRITAYLRGLDIGTGTYGMSTEFMFDGNYIPLHKNRHVRLDQAHLCRRDQGEEASRSLVRLDGPWLFLGRRRDARAGRPRRPADRQAGARRRGIADRAAGRGTGRCRPLPGLRISQRRVEDLLRLRRGARLRARSRSRDVPRRSSRSPRSRTSNPFSGGSVVESGALEGRKALRIDRSYVSLDQPQNWVGYDFLEAELDCASPAPMSLSVEVRDAGHPRLLDPGQLRDGRAPGPEHPDRPREAAIRGREGPARPDAQPGPCHPPGLRYRRQARRAPADG